MNLQTRDRARAATLQNNSPGYETHSAVMILTCPECATSYFVDDRKIAPEGRAVKCASCGHRWTAHPEATLELDVSAEEGAVAREPFEPEVEEPTALSDLPGAELPKVIRAKVETTRKVREAAAHGIVWAGMAATLAIVVGLAVVFRVDVVKIMPGSAKAYALAGLPVNTLGLVIEGSRAEPALQDGHAALSISGMIRNVEDHAIVTPPLKIELLDKAGKTIVTKVARPADPVVPPGETRHFALAILDPPTTAHDLQISFAPDTERSKGKKTRAKTAIPAHPAPEHSLRGAAEADVPQAAHAPDAAHGPAPVEAKPLSSDSPYALEPHG